MTEEEEEVEEEDEEQEEVEKKERMEVEEEERDDLERGEGVEEEGEVRGRSGKDEEGISSTSSMSAPSLWSILIICTLSFFSRSTCSLSLVTLDLGTACSCAIPGWPRVSHICALRLPDDESALYCLWHHLHFLLPSDKIRKHAPIHSVDCLFAMMRDMDEGGVGGWGESGRTECGTMCMVRGIHVWIRL